MALLERSSSRLPRLPRSSARGASERASERRALSAARGIDRSTIRDETSRVSGHPRRGSRDRVGSARKLRADSSRFLGRLGEPIDRSLARASALSRRLRGFPAGFSLPALCRAERRSNREPRREEITARACVEPSRGVASFLLLDSTRERECRP